MPSETMLRVAGTSASEHRKSMLCSLGNRACSSCAQKRWSQPHALFVGEQTGARAGGPRKLSRTLRGQGLQQRT